MQLAPTVGKDSPPDLAHLVPSGVPNSSEQSVDKVTSPNAPQPNNVPKETGQLMMLDFFQISSPCSYLLYSIYVDGASNS